MTVLNLEQYRTRSNHVFSGRPRGEEVRKVACLDVEDGSDGVVQVQIPEDVWSMNASFFLGLFGPSVQHFQSSKEFFQKYKFQCTPQIMEDIESGVEDALKSSSPLNFEGLK